jgi:hypothetical protein
MDIYVRIASNPKADLYRGYSYSMGAFGNESQAHDGLSGYSTFVRGGLRAALLKLDRRMGIVGPYLDHTGTENPMYVAVYAGQLVGDGPDEEELFRPKKLIYYTRTTTETTAPDMIRRIGRAVWKRLSAPDRELLLPPEAFPADRLADIMEWS